ncbi:MAG: lipopolysaccharide biosynthesis protein [Nocardioidaceae bacterium]|nr:lipopolysaccharide biosynthesis protein [Nocardioidaceae bacterium]
MGAASVWFAVSYGLAILGYLAVNAFAGRLLDDTFGYFVIAITVSTMVGQLGLVGAHRGGLREASQLEPGDDAGLRTLRGDVRAVSLVTLPLTSVIAAMVTYALADGQDAGTRWAVTLGMGVLVMLGGQQKLLANYLRGFGHIRFASLLEGRSGGPLVAGFQASLIAGVYFFRPELGLTGALGATAVGYAVPVLLARRRVTQVWKHLGGRDHLFSDLRHTTTHNWRFASNQVGAYLNSTVELWLAGLVLSSAEVSSFGAALRLTVILGITATSLQVVFAPVVARLLGRDDRRLEALLRTGATLAAAGTALILIPMIVMPGPLLQWVYGSGFGTAAPLLLLLAIGNVANVLSGMCGTVLTMSRQEGLAATIQWVAVAIRLVAGLLAATAFGAVGLAVSAAVVTTAVGITLWAVTYRRTGLWTHLTLRPRLRLLRETAG